MEKQLSVIIPCYNHGAYIHEALESVHLSDKKGICEILIINDGSTDPETNEILSKIDDKNVTVILQENGGLASARNKGVELSKCEYLLMLDADNKITPDFITSFLELRRSNTDFDVLHGNALFFGERTGLFKSGPLNVFKIFQKNYIDACSIIKKDCLIEVGKYDGNMPYMGWEDWDLWIRMAMLNKKTIYFDKVFFHYRYLNSSMIRTIGHKEEETKQFLIKKYSNHLIDDRYLSEVLNDLISQNIERMGLKEIIRILINKIKARLNKKIEQPHRIYKLWI